MIKNTHTPIDSPTQTHKHTYRCLFFFFFFFVFLFLFFASRNNKGVLCEKKKMKRLMYFLMKIGQAKNEKKMICMRMCFCVVIKLKHDNTSFSPFLSPPLSLFPFSSSLSFPLPSSRVLPLSCFLSLSLAACDHTHRCRRALDACVSHRSEFVSKFFLF